VYISNIKEVIKTTNIIERKNKNWFA